MAPWKPIKGEPTVPVKYVGNPANKGHGPDVLEDGRGFSFPKGEMVEIPDSLAKRLAKSDHFEVGGAEPVQVDKPQVDDLDGMNIAALRDLADQRGISHEGMSKPQLREALRQ